jgi:hypothetical protein
VLPGSLSWFAAAAHLTVITCWLGWRMSVGLKHIFQRVGRA